jgi:hypothetical protein
MQEPTNSAHSACTKHELWGTANPVITICTERENRKARNQELQKAGIAVVNICTEHQLLR